MGFDPFLGVRVGSITFGHLVDVQLELAPLVRVVAEGFLGRLYWRFFLLLLLGRGRLVLLRASLRPLVAARLLRGLFLLRGALDVFGLLLLFWFLLLAAAALRGHCVGARLGGSFLGTLREAGRRRQEPLSASGTAGGL